MAGVKLTRRQKVIWRRSRHSWGGPGNRRRRIYRLRWSVWMREVNPVAPGLRTWKIQHPARLKSVMLMSPAREPSERGVAMVFQSYALYPHMTVYDNMAFGLKMNGADPQGNRRPGSKGGKILELGPLLERKPAAMSGGQRQRVAIGRSIVREPKVFLFDEPLSNLDAELRVQMRLEIAKLHNDLDSTMIYVTHDQTEAMTLADKIVVLRAGIVEQYGSPLELYDNPDNEFVAGFIGSPRMNFLEAEVTGSKKGSAKITDPCARRSQIRCGHPRPQLPKRGRSVHVGIRPEHFISADGGQAQIQGPDHVWSNNLGGNSYLYLNVGGGLPLTVEQKGHAPGQGCGQVASVGVDPYNSHAVRR